MSIETPTKRIACPICGAPMLFVHGSGWDYDRWHCVEPVDPSASIKVICWGEIELNDSTYPPGVADD